MSIAALAAVGLAAGAFAGTALTVGVAPAPTAADTAVTLDGHGIGHGIGLSQWGAYGYAVDLGWNSAQILDHYYGGTVAGTIPLDTVLPVRLLSLDNKVTTVVSPTGGLLVDGVAGGPWQSVTAQWTGSSYRVYARSSQSCEVGGTTVANAVAGSVTIRTQVDTSITPNYGDLLGVCQSDASLRAYRGVIVATQSGTRTVNQVPMEHYLRSVIAKEMSPGWSTAGGGQGAQALQAQAVAARSYAFAENRYSPYAKTCDTTACQVYVGAATRASVGAGFVQVEYPSTDAAVLATAGVVRRVGNTAGPVAYTMFAASSGGYTLPGNSELMPFPAVFDDGDDTPNNPYHNWSVTLSGSQISAAYPQIGTFTSLAVLSRNGYGDWGGRVLSIKVQGTASSTTVTGDAFKAKFGLKSNWFNVRGSTPIDPCLGNNPPPVGAAFPGPIAARFNAIDPVRLVDTRIGKGAPSGSLPGGCTLVVDPGLPGNASAAVVNITSVLPGAGGYMTAYPCGTPLPTASVLQALPGRVVAATTTVPLGANGTFCIYSSTAGDVLVDLFGSYAPFSGDRFQPVSPTRLYDSRGGDLLAAGTIVHVPVVGQSGTPVGATAAALTLHAVSPAADGFATVYPCSASVPDVSSINFIQSVDIANQAIVALSAGGEVCVQVSAPMHVVVDLGGWYGSAGTAEFVALPPTRVIDTRFGLGLSAPLSAGGNASLALAATAGLPAAEGLAAPVAVVTAVDPSAAGGLTVHPCMSPLPAASHVRYQPGANAAVTVVVPDDVNGQWCLAAEQPTHVVMDVSGYFTYPVTFLSQAATVFSTARRLNWTP